MGYEGVLKMLLQSCDWILSSVAEFLTLNFQAQLG